MFSQDWGDSIHVSDMSVGIIDIKKYRETISQNRYSAKYLLFWKYRDKDSGMWIFFRMDTSIYPISENEELLAENFEQL
mgnify:CR=1 FL=1